MSDFSGSIIWKRGNCIKGSVAYSGDELRLQKMIDSFLSNESNDALRIDWSEFNEESDQLLFEKLEVTNA